MKIAIIGGSGFVGSRLIGLLQTVPNIELLNIDKQQSELYPHLTQIADVQDVQKLTELLAGTDLVVLLWKVMELPVWYSPVLLLSMD